MRSEIMEAIHQKVRETLKKEFPKHKLSVLRTKRGDHFVSIVIKPIEKKGR